MVVKISELPSGQNIKPESGYDNPLEINGSNIGLVDPKSAIFSSLKKGVNPGSSVDVATEEYVDDGLSEKIDNSSVENLNGIEIANILSTGLKQGGELSINADPTKFDISDGSGVIVDNYTDVSNPVIIPIDWSGLDDIDVTNLATADTTYILINSSVSVIQQTTEPTAEDRRNYIYLGRLAHTSRTSITNIVNTPELAISPKDNASDYFHKIGIINEGNLISANGNNLKINKSIGSLTIQSINFHINNKIPNTKNFIAEIQPSIRRRTQTGEGTTSTDLDVANYDDSGTITSILGIKYQNQRVFLTSVGNIVIQYGQVLYNTLAAAISGLQTESFVQFGNLLDSSLIGIISVRSTATDLSDSSQAKILTGFKFGILTGVNAGISVSTLQNTYVNSGSKPEILLNSEQGPLSIRSYDGGEDTNSIEIQDSEGVKKIVLKGNGNILANSVNSNVNEEILSANKNILVTDNQVQFLNPNGANRDVTLYATPMTADSFMFKNIGTGGYNLVLKNNGGTTLATIANNVTVGVIYSGTSWQLV